MAYRRVTFDVEQPNGEAFDTPGSFELVAGSWDATVQVPAGFVEPTEGATSILLWVDDEGENPSAFYRWHAPDGNVRPFHVPLSGAGLDDDDIDETDLSLSTALSAYSPQSLPSFPVVADYIDDALTELADLYFEHAFVFPGAECRMLFRSAFTIKASSGNGLVVDQKTQAASLETDFIFYRDRAGTETVIGTVTYPVADDGTISIAADVSIVAGDIVIWRQVGDCDTTLDYVQATLKAVPA